MRAVHRGHVYFGERWQIVHADEREGSIVVVTESRKWMNEWDDIWLWLIFLLESVTRTSLEVKLDKASLLSSFKSSQVWIDSYNS